MLPDGAKRNTIQQLIFNETDNPKLKVANTRLFNRLYLQRSDFNSLSTRLPVPPFSAPAFDSNLDVDEYSEEQERLMQLNNVNELFGGIYCSFRNDVEQYQ